MKPRLRNLAERLSLQLGVAILVIVVCLCLIGIEGADIWSARRVTLDHGLENTRNLAGAIAQHAEDTFRNTDGAMVGLIDRIESTGTGPEALLGLGRIIGVRVAMMPQLKALGVLDADGKAVVTSLPEPVAANYADRDYFIFHRTHPDRALRIGKPVQSKTKGEWVIPVTRRFDHADGSFAGVVLATVDMAYFQRFYDRFQIGEHGVILLASADGFQLVRRPFDPANVGKDMRHGVLFHDLLPSGAAASAEIRSSTDGTKRLASYRRLDAYPLVASVALAKEDVLAVWREDTASHAIGVGMLVTALAALGFRLSRQIALRMTMQQAAQQATAAAAVATTALSETQARLQAILDNAPVAISLKDRQHRYLLVNRQYEAWFAITRAQQVGRTLAESHSDPAFVRLIEEIDEQVLTTGLPRTSEIYEENPGQPPRWFLVTKFPVRDPDGTIIGLGTVNIDISERHHAAEALRAAKEAAEEANRAKSDFLASMSHEIRTPMNGIIGFADLLLAGGLEGEQQRRATLIKDSAKSLLAILNDILDLSKIEAGRLELETIAVSLPGVVDGAASIVRTEATANGLDLHTEIEGDLPDWIMGDPTRLRQILLNLLSNAVKFTPSGGITVSVMLDDTAPRTGLRFAVTDTGIGIPADRQHVLFQNFSQIDRSVTRRFGGTGLGLAICKRLVEAMGGSIGVESEEGRGSTFWFTIPLVVADAPAFISQTPAPAGSHARVLVVDDLLMNQLVVEGLLTMAGHDAVTVDNGAAAVEAVQAQPFDLVLMDMEMPIMDGITATKAIRRLPAPLSSIPVVALTANAMPVEVARCRAAGMNDHLTKPVDQEALLAAVDRWAAAFRSGRPS
ncbi:hypothetical protein GCM10011611_61260 [Aliidongia dinghuensis]|uniref:histidine kinase n=1 Tax=Aliidongia dinghuensis TaxID=1867774 RepID=A0A8J2Z1B9_9PROT|nr:ATP-binding protein [Aliidongia dinghuensis]GGF46595.1 hypothetical protein GCM10011611_61260 [Aliidongia dinghuensis]